MRSKYSERLGGPRPASGRLGSTPQRAADVPVLRVAGPGDSDPRARRGEGPARSQLRAAVARCRSSRVQRSLEAPGPTQVVTDKEN